MTIDNVSNAKRMFKHACAFVDCAYFCESESNSAKRSTQWHTVPNIVNSAFACEVFMKSLLIYYGMTHEDTKRINHGLDDLWEELKVCDVAFTNMIENSIKSCFDTSREDFFDEMLSYISKAFIEWRYIYEGKNVTINLNFLRVLRDYLRDGCCYKYYNMSWNEFFENHCDWNKQ